MQIDQLEAIIHILISTLPSYQPLLNSFLAKNQNNSLKAFLHTHLKQNDLKDKLWNGYLKLQCKKTPCQPFWGSSIQKFKGAINYRSKLLYKLYKIKLCKRLSSLLPIVMPFTITSGMNKLNYTSDLFTKIKQSKRRIRGVWQHTIDMEHHIKKTIFLHRLHLQKVKKAKGGAIEEHF